MTFLFLVVVGLLVWIVRLQGRVATLEARDSERADELVSLKARVAALERRASRRPAAGQAGRAGGAAAPTPAAGSTAPLAVPAPRPRPTPAAATAGPSRRSGHRAAAASPAQAAGLPRPPAPAAPPAARPQPAAPAPAPPRVRHAPPSKPFDWEELIGVRLFSWVAGIALAVAGVFFLGYSIQQGWLQPPVRMAIGLARRRRPPGRLRAEGRAALPGHRQRDGRRGHRHPVLDVLRRLPALGT